MREILGKLRPLFRRFSLTSLLFLLISPTLCRAYVAPYCPSSPATITSITPSTWIAGKTYTITIRGNGFIPQDLPPPGGWTCKPAYSNVRIGVDTGFVSVLSQTAESKEKITAIVEPDASDPTETACVFVDAAYAIQVVRAPVGVTTNASAASAATPAATATTPEICRSWGGYPVQILGNQIMWSQATTSYNVISVIDDGSGTPPPTQSAVVGQQIHLTTSDIPKDINVTKRIWTVGGTRIADYKPTTASDSVKELKDDDLQNKNEITYYWVYPNDPNDPNANFPVTYEYCADIPGKGNQCSKAKAAFTVSGPTGGKMTFTPIAQAVTIANLTICVDPYGKTWPGGPWMIYATGVTGPACPGEANYSKVGINFNNPTGYINDSNGVYSLVQLISSDTITGESAGNYSAGLDTDYPYGWPPDSDSPKVYLRPTATSVTRDFKANMFLMWTSNNVNSIPVPIGYQTWGFSSTATCSIACGAPSSWDVKTKGTPGPVGNFVPSTASQAKVENNVLVKGIPTWISPSY